MAKTDIIIPAFNAKATIQRALASIACQTLVEDIKTTIINDCTEYDFNHFLKELSK